MDNFILTEPRYCEFRQALLLLSEIQKTLLVDVEAHAEITARLKALEESGEERINASPYWLDGRYLYLVIPQTAERPRYRRYIGNKPERVQKAERAVALHKRQVRLSKERHAIERRSNRLVRLLTRFIDLTQREI